MRQPYILPCRPNLPGYPLADQTGRWGHRWSKDRRRPHFFLAV